MPALLHVRRTTQEPVPRVACLLATIASTVSGACWGQTSNSAQPSQTTVTKGGESTSAPAEIRVEGTRPTPPALLDEIQLFGKDFVEHSDGFTADEVLADLTASLPTGQQVVFIDGHESTVDISTIPASKIDRIEVSTSGIMPDGRPRIFGTVINIILKQDYNGANFGARRRASFAGGGGQSQFNAFGAATVGKFNGSLNLIHREQDPLLASGRDFSSSQHYAAVGGADYRAPYGTTPVVQAVTGPLTGVFDSNGAPATIALSPDALGSGSLTPSDFIAAPPGTRNASGLKHFDTAAFIYLVAPSKSNIVNADFTYSVASGVKLHAGYAYQHSDSQQVGPPPITSISTLTVVPAADNPFGQPVEIGMVHTGFGGVRRDSSSSRSSGYLSADGHLGASWEWSSSFDLNHRISGSNTDALDAGKFAAALASADPALRFNPFADTGPGSANAALYPSLTSIRQSDATTDDTRLRASGHGQIADGWVAPILLRASFQRSTNISRQDVDPGILGIPALDTHSHLTTTSFNANVDIPVFKVRELESPAVFTVSTYVLDSRQQTSQGLSGTGPPQRLSVSVESLNGLLNIPWAVPEDKRRWLYNAQTQLGAGFSHSAGITILTAQLGALWAPLSSVTLRGNYSRQQVPAPLALYFPTTDYNQTLIDRVRASTIATNVEVISNQPQAQSPPVTSRLLASADWVPPTFDKARLTLTYSDVTQQGQIRNFSAQDILDNEAALPGRVTRLPPTADQIAAGLPGDVSQVDITPFTGGQREDRSLIFQAQYHDNSKTGGALNLRSITQHVLSSTNELPGGLQIVSTNDQEAPPSWTSTAQADWQRRQWGAAASFSFASGGFYAGLPYPSFTTLDARVSYTFDRVLGGWLGKTLRIGAGIQNLFDRNPPSANTITGFRGGSPLGRTYEVTFRSGFGD